MLLMLDVLFSFKSFVYIPILITMNTYTMLPNLSFQRVLTGIWGRRRRYGEEKDVSHIH